MTPELWAGIITGALAATASVLAACVPAYLSLKKDNRSLRKDTRETKQQVTNDHTTNLREEISQNHAAVVQLITTNQQHSQAAHQQLQSQLGGIRGDMADLRKVDQSLADRILDIERHRKAS